MSNCLTATGSIPRNKAMDRTRKKYLVFRKDKDVERALVGVFSSRKRATDAIGSECRKEVASCERGHPGFTAFVENTGDRVRLVTGPGKEKSFSIEMRLEDKA